MNMVGNIYGLDVKRGPKAIEILYEETGEEEKEGDPFKVGNELVRDNLKEARYCLVEGENPHYVKSVNFMKSALEISKDGKVAASIGLPPNKEKSKSYERFNSRAKPIVEEVESKVEGSENSDLTGYFENRINELMKIAKEEGITD